MAGYRLLDQFYEKDHRVRIIEEAQVYFLQLLQPPSLHVQVQTFCLCSQVVLPILRPRTHDGPRAWCTMSGAPYSFGAPACTSSPTFFDMGCPHSTPRHSLLSSIGECQTRVPLNGNSGCISRMQMNLTLFPPF
jgi:hypothetical protein